jgi:hypothetical protein
MRNKVCPVCFHMQERSESTMGMGRARNRIFINSQRWDEATHTKVKIRFSSNILHPFCCRLFIDDANPGRIIFEGFAGKRINMVNLFFLCHLIYCNDSKSNIRIFVTILQLSDKRVYSAPFRVNTRGRNDRQKDFLFPAIRSFCVIHFRYSPVFSRIPRNVTTI